MKVLNELIVSEVSTGPNNSMKTLSKGVFNYFKNFLRGIEICLKKFLMVAQFQVSYPTWNSGKISAFLGAALPRPNIGLFTASSGTVRNTVEKPLLGSSSLNVTEKGWKNTTSIRFTHCLSTVASTFNRRINWMSILQIFWNKNNTFSEGKQLCLWCKVSILHTWSRPFGAVHPSLITTRFCHSRMAIEYGEHREIFENLL